MDNRTLLQKTGLTQREFASLVGVKLLPTGHPNSTTTYRWFKEGVSSPIWVNLMLRYAVAFPAYVGWLREQKAKQSE